VPAPEVELLRPPALRRLVIAGLSDEGELGSVLGLSFEGLDLAACAGLIEVGHEKK
jgi:hypothetical protein